MTTKYINYINENFISDKYHQYKIYNMLKNIMKSYTNTNLKVEIKDINSGKIVPFVYLNYKEINNLFIFVKYQNYKYVLVNYMYHLTNTEYPSKDIHFNNIKEVKEYLVKYFNSFYTENLFDFIINNKHKIKNIPVFNINHYSKFILKLIQKDNSILNYKEYFEEYLNNETLEKIKHLLNAKNFDLI